MRLRSTPIPLAAAARASPAVRGRGGYQRRFPWEPPPYLGSNLPGAGSMEIKR